MLKQLRFCLSLSLTVLLLISFVHQRPLAQSPTPGASSGPGQTDKAQLYQALLDLTNPWTVMCVAAHPDDEDGSTLVVLRRKYGVHTVSLFSTYGEGGQNAVGPELYEELGVIRARETMAAAEVQGSEPRFLGLRDFGFSKSAEETFRAWGEKEALRRMVLQIRQLRPDVIITNHDTTRGHGHHQATGRLILQAFDAAADPQQFPEQLIQVSTWQPQRLFVRLPRNQSEVTQTPGSQNSPEQIVTIDPNERDPVRDSSYAQQALNGLQQHATQGPWPKTVSPSGARMIRYKLAREATGALPLPADAKTPLAGLQLPESIRPRMVAPTIDRKPLAEFSDRLGEVLVSLINARKRGAFTAPEGILKSDPQRFQLMSSRLDKALALASGVSLSLSTNETLLIPGVKARFAVSLANSGDAEIEIERLEFRGLGQLKSLDAADKLLPGTETTGEFEVTPDKAAELSVPSSDHLYDGRLFGADLATEADLELEGARFSVTAAKRIALAPPVEILSISPSPYISTPGTLQQKPKFDIKLRNNLTTEFRGLVKINGPNLETGREVVLPPHETQAISVEVGAAVPINRQTPKSSGMVVSVNLLDRNEAIISRSVQTSYADAKVVQRLHVGYLPSFDQTLQMALRALGVDSRQLTLAEIQSGALAGFDTIIIDNRGYEAHPELIPANDRLLKYVADGGTLLVLYHKTNEWNPDDRDKRPQLAPYPIILSDDRVTEEDAPIEFLKPRHPLLNFPNRITRRDFANWVQERGLYFPKEWDPRYTPLLSTHDKGEPPLRGGLLVGRYGKGNYIYTSMVWYRQLRAGIPGGYRLFANLISYGSRTIRK